MQYMNFERIELRKRAVDEQNYFVVLNLFSTIIIRVQCIINWSIEDKKK